MTPSSGRAAEPPNQNDPCSSAGRNTCGTLGVGSYVDYRYGVRWFGDFRGAMPKEPHTFCLDLRYWYASPAYRYRELASAELRNADGEAVPVERQQKIAYSIWNYGQSTKPDQQAAVALYVHSLMGDARPGEVDPAAVNPAVVSLYETIARDATRFHGPYRIETRFSDRLAVGREGRATIRVLSATGKALPNVPLGFSARGASGLPEQVRTNDQGVASVPLTPTAADSVRLTVEAGPVASTLPRILGATTEAAAPNAQRLAAPSSQRLSFSASAPVKRQISVSTLATPARVAVGKAGRDQVTIAGALPSWGGTVTVRIHGPFPSPAAIRCDGAPAWEGSFPATGSGVFTTPAAKLEQVGWYTYQEVVPGDALHLGLTTPCAVPSETFRVEAKPRVETTVSARRAELGTAIFDRVLVQGLAGQSATVQAALYGPFATREAITCDTEPVWRGSLVAPSDGEYRTEPFTLTVPGFYTYKEWIDESDFAAAIETGCGEAAETTVAGARPSVTTVVSTEVTRPGARIFDRIEVAGLGPATAEIQVQLFGPFATRSELQCSGRPYWTGTVTAKSDGVIESPSVQVAKAGFYTYRERVIGSPLVAESATECALAAETSLVAPAIATGRGDAPRDGRAPSGLESRPTRVRLPSVEIDAPVSPVGIDLAGGVLGVPADISRTGWWRDGRAPGAKAGAVLIAGHVDSERAGPGALYSLSRARAGDRVQVGTADGSTFTYRVVSVRSYPRNALPTSVYSRKGSPRLVLVTCGGPFDPAAGHYRDNVVVTAVPA